jgi:hypothetical protein
MDYAIEADPEQVDYWITTFNSLELEEGIQRLFWIGSFIDDDIVEVEWPRNTGGVHPIERHRQKLKAILVALDSQVTFNVAEVAGLKDNISSILKVL